MTNCPKCGSNDLVFIDYAGIKCIVCKKCGYDERDEYALDMGEKTNQKAKGEYSPYKSGRGLKK